MSRINHSENAPRGDWNSSIRNAQRSSGAVVPKVEKLLDFENVFRSAIEVLVAVTVDELNRGVSAERPFEDQMILQLGSLV
jgi:hypothetical protein